MSGGKKKVPTRQTNGEEGSTKSVETVGDSQSNSSASVWQPSPAVLEYWNKTLKFMESRPVATLWARLPFRFEILLFVMAAAVRFYHLDYPDSVVFDEYHFGGFVNKYNTGNYFFDIHPPLGKLTFFWIGQLTGYDPSVCKYDSIHLEYDEKCQYMTFRIIAGG